MTTKQAHLCPSHTAQCPAKRHSAPPTKGCQAAPRTAPQALQPTQQPKSSLITFFFEKILHCAFAQFKIYWYFCRWINNMTMDVIPEKTRIKDIAELSGVSVGTVDRVLHNRPNVSKAAREKVEKALKEMDYKPNMYASALLLHHTQARGRSLLGRNRGRRNERTRAPP